MRNLQILRSHGPHLCCRPLWAAGGLFTLSHMWFLKVRLHRQEKMRICSAAKFLFLLFLLFASHVNIWFYVFCFLYIRLTYPLKLKQIWRVWARGYEFLSLHLPLTVLWPPHLFTLWKGSTELNHQLWSPAHTVGSRVGTITPKCSMTSQS